jgi:hypothetical protein
VVLSRIRVRMTTSLLRNLCRYKVTHAAFNRRPFSLAAAADDATFLTQPQSAFALHTAISRTPHMKAWMA